MRTFLVTGGAGFIGSHIAEALVAAAIASACSTTSAPATWRTSTAFRDKIEFIEGDLLDAATVAAGRRRASIASSTRRRWPPCRGASRPAGHPRPLRHRHGHAAGRRSRAGVRRVVYAASSSAYGDQPTSSKRETDLPAPISPYGAAKLAAEYYCQAFTATYGLETVALRYFNVFGPRQDPNSPYSAVIPLFITAMLAGRRPIIYGDGRQSRDFTFVANVVHANLLAADAPGVAGRVFNCANGASTNLLTLMDVLNRLLGTDVQPIHDRPASATSAKAWPTSRQARTARLRAAGRISRKACGGRSTITGR